MAPVRHEQRSSYSGAIPIQEPSPRPFCGMKRLSAARLPSRWLYVEFEAMKLVVLIKEGQFLLSKPPASGLVLRL